METKFLHEIRVRFWNENNSEFTITSKWFKNSFTKSAYRWFDKDILSRYPNSKKIKDTTIAGYHYEIGDLIFELH